MTTTTRWAGLLASERAWRSEDTEGVNPLRETLYGRGFVAIDGGVSGAALVIRPWKRWPVVPYLAEFLTDENALFRLGQAAAEVDAAAIVAEAGYLNVRQPSSLTTARACGLAIGAIAAHAGIPMHLVHVPPATWQEWSLDLSTAAARDERKRQAIDAADLAMRRLDARPIGDGQSVERRSAFCDAWGIATWWATAPRGVRVLRR